MRGRSRRKEVDTELNITAFLNLMVVLIPFLLMSAAFTQLSVLELNLPSANPNEDNKKKEPKPAFELTVAKNFLVVNNRNKTPNLPAGILTVIENESSTHDFTKLTDYLVKLKEGYEEIDNITILLEEDTPYFLLIQAMDSVRLSLDDEGNESELFPNISIGDAPVAAIKILNEKFGGGAL